MEIWKDIIGFEDAYQVSDRGRVRSKTRSVICKNGTVKNYNGKVLTAKPNSSGYLRVELKYNGKTERWFVHRLVALHFVENQDKDTNRIVNHLDSNHLNNSASNLEWTTLLGNSQHALKNGRLVRTESWLKNQKASLKKYQKPVEGYLMSNGRCVERFESVNESAKHGYSPSCIVSCCQGKRQHHKGLVWKYVST